MPNSGDGATWQITLPADNDNESLGAQEIRGLRAAAGLRLGKEHRALADGTIVSGALGASGGGEHLPGSAIVYVGASAPTLRPDALTALNDNDAGRLWIDANGVMRYWAVGTPDGWNGVVSEYYLAGTVATAALADGAVTTAKLADSGVTSAKIANGNVNTAELADGGVTTAKLADGAVTTAKLADGGVTTAKIAAAAITAALMATAPVYSTNYTGNASANRQLTGMGFDPKFVFIFESTTSAIGYAVKNFNTTNSKFFIPNGGGANIDIASAINFIAGGIQINPAGSQPLNKTGLSYWLIAIG